MTGKHPEPDQSAQDFAQQGAKGFAARSVGGRPSGSSTASLRRALKRVGGAAVAGEPPPPPSPKPAATRGAKPQAARATQALLGIVGESQGADDAQITERLGGLTAAQLQRLGRLLSVVQENRGGGARGQVLGDVERRLLERGVKLDVKAGNVTINVNSSSVAPQDAQPTKAPMAQRRSGGANPGLLWARRLARLKDFIEGR